MYCQSCIQLANPPMVFKSSLDVYKRQGMGMSPGFLQHIFEPFTRGQDSIANRIEGTGLGLSITKGLVDLMGGKIGVESQEGVGSTFRVELAFAIMAPKTKENHQAVTASLPLGAGVIAGRRFLIVEDNDINAEIISEILLQYHAHIMVQKDGAQAVQAFQEAEPGTFDAILMDIQMPVLNGYEATRRIRALPHPNAKRIPIIAMTANAFHEDVQAALDAGMNAHIAKPVDVGLLIRTLQTVLPEQK